MNSTALSDGASLTTFVEHRYDNRRIEIDENIEIALVVLLAAGDRTKQGGRPHGAPTKAVRMRSYGATIVA